MHNPLILIPARLGSTRLPNKPLADIAGLPMIIQVMKRAEEADLARIVVACDHSNIAAAVTKAGGEAILTDASLPSGSDRIYQALQKIDAEKKHDVIINLQGDMPALDPVVIAQVLEPLADSANHMATLAAKITTAEERTNPAVVKVVIAQNNRALYFSRALIPANAGDHHHHIGIYAYRRDTLEEFVALPPSPLELREKLEQLRALEAGMNIGIKVVDTVPLGVDTAEQLQEARRVLSVTA